MSTTVPKSHWLTVFKANLEQHIPYRIKTCQLTTDKDRAIKLDDPFITHRKNTLVDKFNNKETRRGKGISYCH